MTAKGSIQHQLPDGTWVDSTPIPLQKPPTFRAILWAWIRRRPRPDWTPTDRDPNPNERWWRRG